MTATMEQLAEIRRGVRNRALAILQSAEFNDCRLPGPPGVPVRWVLPRERAVGLASLLGYEAGELLPMWAELNHEVLLLNLAVMDNHPDTWNASHWSHHHKATV